MEIVGAYNKGGLYPFGFPLFTNIYKQSAKQPCWVELLFFGLSSPLKKDEDDLLVFLRHIVIDFTFKAIVPTY